MLRSTKVLSIYRNNWPDICLQISGIFLPHYKVFLPNNPFQNLIKYPLYIKITPYVRKQN